ncbi:MAG: hypothetical protein Q7J54_06805 [Candidatus Woesearchaeota archaeon]|nr:hypothetical protein [Candidatus Woesearchaeota archaeon]
MTTNKLYLRLSKAHRLLKSGCSLESVHKVIKYPGHTYLLRCELERLLGYTFRKNQRHPEMIKDACSFISVRYNGNDFVVTQMAKRQYCRQYSLDISEWDNSWTNHLCDNLKAALSRDGAYKTTHKRAVRSEDLVFSLISDLVIGVEIRVDNYIPASGIDGLANVLALKHP